MSLVTNRVWAGRFLAALATVAVGLPTAGALGQVYSNSTPISILDFSPATPYPSTITVAGGPTSISGIKVSLFGGQHLFWGQVRILLVGPLGQAIELKGHDTTSLDGTSVFSTIPTALQPSGGSFAFGAPAPAPPYAQSWSAIQRTNANGAWKLYVQDISEVFSGSFTGGWSIEFAGTPLTDPAPNAFTYQGRLTGGPANGAIDVRFSLWTSAAGTSEFDRVSDPVTVNGVPLAGGLFTATADPGRVPQDRKTWLQVEVANPAGSAFVALTPRQPMTFAPLANNAAYNPTTVGGFHGTADRGVKALSGYDAPIGEFNGMKAIVAPGTNNCGNSGDVAFFTWECNTSVTREIMRITGRGNVGIGTSAPAQKLHVVGNILASGTITPSCGALKQNIRPMRDALDRIAALDAVRFDWKPDEAKIRGFTHDLGFIAEDVARVFPEVVFRDDRGAVIGLDYARMSAVAVGAIKQLKSDNDRIKGDNAELRARLEKIEAMLAGQAAQEGRP